MSHSLNPQRSGRWVTALLCGLACIAGVNAWLSWKSFTRPTWGFMPKQMAMAQYLREDMPGDLGGMPVNLPREVAEFVEYDADPRFGERRLGPVPQRTHKSVIRSFGFQLRFPDWATFATPGVREQFRQARVSTSQWIWMGVTSGEFHPQDGFLDRAAYVTLVRQGPYPLDRYEEIQSEYPGLAAFGIRGANPETGRRWRESNSASDIFIARDHDGKVTTYITCGTQPRNASCQQSWSLERIGIKTKLSASYPRQMLNHWKEIQHAGTQTILGFSRRDALFVAGTFIR